MSIQTASLASTISTTSVFQSVVAAHRGMFAAIGLVRVPFTGEINPSTVAAPTTPNTIRGYEIWRFDDALQATAPVYLKVGYGCASTGNFRLSLSVGTGTDGAGALTGAVTPTMVMSMGDTSANVYATYVSGDSGRLLLRFWPELNAYSMDLISVERIPSATGQSSGDGIVAWLSSSQYFNEAHSIRFADGRVDSYTSAPYLISTIPPGSSGAVDADVPLYPVRAWVGRRETRPLHNLLAYHGADIAAGNLIAVTCWDGVVRRYLPLGISISNSYGLAGGASYQYIAIRWE